MGKIKNKNFLRILKTFKNISKSSKNASLMNTLTGKYLKYFPKVCLSETTILKNSDQSNPCKVANPTQFK